MEGSRLKRLRKSRGLSAQQLAEQVGVTSQHLYGLEGGRYTPSLRTLNKLAAALAVPVAWFWVSEGYEQAAAILDQYPADLLSFLARPEAVDYVRLAAELANIGAPPEAVSALVAAVKAIKKTEPSP